MADELTKALRDELYDMYESMYEHYDIRSFSQLESLESTEDIVEDLSTLVSMLSYMLYNISYNSDDKVAESRKAIQEFNSMVETLLSESTTTKEKKSVVERLKSFVDTITKSRKKKKKMDSSAECVGQPKMMRKDKSGMMLWKDANGTYRWFASYSNNYRDDSMPSDIISKESHANFVNLVDSGQASMPELWHWHQPGTQWGVADWVAFDEENGIAMASGVVLKGHEQEAQAMMDMDVEIGVSHGMPKSTVVRDEKDKSVIRSHVTVEISDLPKWAAANQLTDFYIFEETTEEKSMGIPENKKDYLRKAGLSEGTIANIEAGNIAKAQLADELGIESKEKSSVSDHQDSSVAETTPTQETTEEVAENKEVNDATVTVEVVTKEVLTSVVESLSKTIAEGFALINSRIVAVEGKVEAMETKENANPIPAASLAALIATELTATKSKGNVINKNNPLTKEAPVETPVEEKVYSADPIANAIMSSVLGK